MAAINDVHAALNALWQAIASDAVTPEDGETSGRLLACQRA
jgi:hypothetical protein